jgi:hypothetical protein
MHLIFFKMNPKNNKTCTENCNWEKVESLSMHVVAINYLKCLNFFLIPFLILRLIRWFIFYSRFISFPFLLRITQWIRNTHASHPKDSTGFMRFNRKVYWANFHTKQNPDIFCNNLLTHRIIFMCTLALPFLHYHCHVCVFFWREGACMCMKCGMWGKRKWMQNVNAFWKVGHPTMTQKWVNVNFRCNL